MADQMSSLRSESATQNPGSTTEKQSFGEMVKEVTDDVFRLMRQEVQLAKLEMKDEATAAAKAGGMLGGAGVAAHIFLIFTTLTVMFALNELMPVAWAALIVSGLWGIAAYTLYSLGRKRMANVNLAPELTVKEMKEDARWLQNRNN